MRATTSGLATTAALCTLGITRLYLQSRMKIIGSGLGHRWDFKMTLQTFRWSSSKLALIRYSTLATRKAPSKCSTALLTKRIHFSLTAFIRWFSWHLASYLSSLLPKKSWSKSWPSKITGSTHIMVPTGIVTWRPSAITSQLLSVLFTLILRESKVSPSNLNCTGTKTISPIVSRSPFLMRIG